MYLPQNRTTTKTPSLPFMNSKVLFEVFQLKDVPHTVMTSLCTLSWRHFAHDYDVTLHITVTSLTARRRDVTASLPSRD